MGSVLELIFCFSQSSHQNDEHYKKIMKYIVLNSFCLKMVQTAYTFTTMFYMYMYVHTHVVPFDQMHQFKERNLV